MQAETIGRELLSFIANSPTAYHAVEEMRKELEDLGYERLPEQAEWKIKAGGKYYVIRNGSSLIAWRIPEGKPAGFHIVASHSDSPGLKVKENPEMDAEGDLVKLNVEKYGGMICSTWFDRPLGIAGRLLIHEEGRLVPRLVDLGEDVCLIPSLAIHMNREVNEGVKYKVQKDMLPLYGSRKGAKSLLQRAAEAIGTRRERIAGYDLFVYNRMPGSIWGGEKEFLSSSRLDDLQCAFSSFQAFLSAGEGDRIPVHCVFDNEEVGSMTRQGADSTFLADVLARISEGLGNPPGRYRQMLASSFLVSADNAHGVHPNYSEKACPTNRPELNGGVVLKFSANQRYTTDGFTAAVFRQICDRAGVPCQVFANHSDMAGGSTLGNLSGTQVSVPTVDIGLAQLAMHSAYETGGSRDTGYLIRALQEFYQSSLVEEADGSYVLI